MQAEVQKALEVLKGKAIWAPRRAADMATFQFGERSVAQDFYGRPTEVGEFALHIQCPWRIVKRDRFVVGSNDLYYPAEHSHNDDRPSPSDFDWDREPNLRDKLLRTLFGPGEPQLTVRGIETGCVGSFRLILENDTFLEVFPNGSIPHEHWRLFSPKRDRPELVVTGAGIETR